MIKGMGRIIYNITKETTTRTAYLSNRRFKRGRGGIILFLTLSANPHITQHNRRFILSRC